MGRKPSVGLTWREDGRWCKQYRGRWFYFSAKDLGKTRSEPIAKQAFKEWKLKVDLSLADAEESEDSTAIGLIQREQERLLSEFPDTLETRLHYSALAKLADHVRRKVGPETVDDFCEVASMISKLAKSFEQWPKGATLSAPGPLPSEAQPQSAEGSTRPRITVRISDPAPPPGIPPWQSEGAETERPEKLSGLVARFLKSLENRVSASRYEKVRLTTKRFLEEASDVPLKEINANLLLGYRDRLIATKRAAVTIRDNLVIIRQMIYWAYRAEIIDQIPRALERGWTVPIAIQEVKPASVDEVRALIAVASEREKLYLLLAANLGYGPKDISELRKDEIEWATGIVSRKRTKTKRLQNSPTISYELWPETLKLLKKFESSHEHLVLTTEKGSPLVSERKRLDGSLIRSDAIHSAWVRLCRKVETPIQLKQLRKTSASLLANDPSHNKWVDHFLGHTPKSTSAKHYVKLDNGPFHEALRWLRSHYVGRKRSSNKPPPGNPQDQ